MGRYQSTVVTSWLAGLVMLVIPPCGVVAQAQPGGPPLAAAVVAEQGRTALARTWRSTVADAADQSHADRSAAKTIALHAGVGTGAGLIIGLVLSGASVSDDRTSVVVTWTALGAAAGVVSGVVTWLVGRRQ